MWIVRFYVMGLLCLHIFISQTLALLSCNVSVSYSFSDGFYSQECNHMLCIVLTDLSFRGLWNYEICYLFFIHKTSHNVLLLNCNSEQLCHIYCLFPLKVHSKICKYWIVSFYWGQYSMQILRVLYWLYWLFSSTLVHKLI